MYGIFSTADTPPRAGFRVGDQVIDLAVAHNFDLFHPIDLPSDIFEQSTLNDFISLDKSTHRAVRQRLADLIDSADSELYAFPSFVFVPLSGVTLHLPVRISDYTDFYAGIHHAKNVGRMFRPDGDPLLPNYRHMPVAYHGRASSIVVSGTPIRRPNGQRLGPDNQPVFGPSRALDFELELGLIIGKSNPLGEPVPVDEAEDYIFGVTLFNDWSARDIQRWEYQPLGPFLGKNFGSSMSAWIVPFADLEPFRVAGPMQEPSLLPYLQATKPGHFDLPLEVVLQPNDGPEQVISRSNARYLYWSFAQMIAHHTVNGCNLNVSDVLATGTISGPELDACGSLLELSWNGTRPLTLLNGSTGTASADRPTQRTFLQDGDTVTLRGWGESDGQRVDLGNVSGAVMPSR
ncbi:fumarylacetoacetase [Spirosoma arcticum]